MAPRLIHYGREAITQLEADIADVRQQHDAIRAALEQALRWNARREPTDVARELGALQRALIASEGALAQVGRRERTDVEPLLERRGDRAPSVDARLDLIDQTLASLAASVARLEAERPPIRVVKPPDERLAHEG